MFLFLPYKKASEAARTELHLARLVLRINGSNANLSLTPCDEQNEYRRLVKTTTSRYSSQQKVESLIRRIETLSWRWQARITTEMQLDKLSARAAAKESTQYLDDVTLCIQAAERAGNMQELKAAAHTLDAKMVDMERLECIATQDVTCFCTQLPSLTTEHKGNLEVEEYFDAEESLQRDFSDARQEQERAVVPAEDASPGVVGSRSRTAARRSRFIEDL